MIGRTLAAVAAVVWVVAGTDARAAVPPAGVLAQLGGLDGCVYDPRGGSAQGLHVDLPGRCAAADSLDGAYEIVMSPNGQSVYVASFQGDSVSAFTRDRASGRLSQLPGFAGCFVDDPFDSPCSPAPALDGVAGLAVSPDGRNLYAASYFSGAVVTFARDRATGELRPLDGPAGCVAEIGIDYDCAFGTALRGAAAVAVSPDGRSVYVASAVSSALAVFRRDPGTGALTQLEGAAGCVRDAMLEVEEDACARAYALDSAGSVAVSRDGRNVYVAAFGSAGVAVFARNRTTGAVTALPGVSACVSEARVSACGAARGLEGPFGVTVSPDGKNVYVATGFDRRIGPDAGPVTGSFDASGVAAFARNPTTGALRQLPGRAGCVSERPLGNGCADGRALEGALAVRVSADGRNVYVAASASNAIAVFARDARGALAQLRGVAGCVSETGTGGACRDGTGLWGASAIALSPDGRHAYAPGFFSSAVAVFSRTAPRRGGR